MPWDRTGPSPAPSPGADTLSRTRLTTAVLLPILILMLIGIRATSVEAASFDCAKATTWVEHAVCGDPALSTLDERMSKLYLDARWRIRKDIPATETLREAQRVWMRERNRCGSLACIARTYDRRIRMLMERTDADLVIAETIEEAGPHWTIEAHYPRLDLPDPAGEIANRAILGWVEAEIADFREQARAVEAQSELDAAEGGSGPECEPGSQTGSRPGVGPPCRAAAPSTGRAGAQPEAASEPGSDQDPEPASTWPGADWSLDLDYGAVHQAKRFIAIPLSGYVFTGGAHGMPIGAYLVLDRQTGEPIPPEGLFEAGGDWLSLLSKRAFEVLRERDLLTTDGDWLRTGTAPDPANYQHLFPGPDGLVITFLPYSVAPYAAGIQEVLIPYAELDGLLNPRLFAR